METRVVRPSTKTVGFWYGLAALAVVAGAGLYMTIEWFEDKPQWLMAIPAVLFWVPLRKHFSTRLITLTLDGSCVTIATGLLSRNTRTLDVTKIAEVSVSQTILQRILNIGDLGLQITGEERMHTIGPIDRPREIADIILAAAKGPAARPSQASAG